MKFLFSKVASAFVALCPLLASAQSLPKYEILPLNKAFFVDGEHHLQWVAIKIDRVAGVMRTCVGWVRQAPARDPEAKCHPLKFDGAPFAIKSFAAAPPIIKEYLSPSGGSASTQELWLVSPETGRVLFCIHSGGTGSRCVDAQDDP